MIPGYGHAVLRCPDPRFSAFIKFGQDHIKNDDVFGIVDLLFKVVPGVLKEHGKAKNPWPNVDAASGSLLYYYGLKEFTDFSNIDEQCSSLLIKPAKSRKHKRHKRRLRTPSSSGSRCGGMCSRRQ